MVDAIRSDHVHVGQLMLKAGSLPGAGTQRTKLERLRRASAPQEVGESRYARSLLWQYNYRARDLQPDDSHLIN
jgi:hypothetical protein